MVVAEAPTIAPADEAAEYLFGHDHWSVGRDILRDIFQPHARVAVKGCHASGKTFAAADAVLMALFEGADVITTAPTDDQVKGVIWRQIHESLRDSRVTGWGDVLQKEIHLGDGIFAVGRSTNTGVRFHGYHARDGSYLLIIVDEAPGLQADLFGAIEGIAAGGDVRVLMLGNPTEPSGPFYDVFASESPIWRRYTIDAFDTPNLRGLSLDDVLTMPDDTLAADVRGYLVTRRWVRDRYYEWGTDHPEWQARVRGEFPQNADVSLIWRSWIDAARTEAHYAADGGSIVAGVDVAGPGEDETVCCVRQGAHLLDARAITSPDPRGAVLDFLRAFAPLGLRHVNVDTAGIGWYLYLHLQEHLGDVSVNAINVGEAPTSNEAKEKHVNLKAELYWGLRERFQAGDIDGIRDHVLINQLAGIRYSHDSRGRVKIETKDDARKRGVKSPDRAEALMLCYAPSPSSTALVQAFKKQAVRR